MAQSVWTGGSHHTGLAALPHENIQYTCENILTTLRNYKFADIQGQGFMPIYESNSITDALYKICGFETDYEFITKRKMKEIQKLSKQPPIKS